MTSTQTEALNETWSFMTKAPWSIPYVIISIVALYFIGKLSFFNSIQLQHKYLFEKRKKSTLKEIFSTIVFGFIVILLIIGFFAIVTSGIK